jgi:hypothetical protein
MEYSHIVFAYPKRSKSPRSEYRKAWRYYMTFSKNKGNLQQQKETKEPAKGKEVNHKLRHIAPKA